MSTTRAPSVSILDILSPEAYPWRHFVKAAHPEGPGYVDYLFYSPQKRSTCEQTLAAFPALRRLASPVEPYTEFMTEWEADVVACWLSRRAWYQDVQIVTVKIEAVLPPAHYPIERAIGVLDSSEIRQILSSEGGWSGFPLHVVSTWQPKDNCPVAPQPLSPEDVKAALETLLADGLIEIVPDSGRSGEPRYRAKQR